MASTWKDVVSLTIAVVVVARLYLVASMVKWIALDPYLVLRNSDSKLYTNFEFREENIHKHLKNILIYKANRFMNFVLDILEHGASGVQVGDIEQTTI
jgi:hypothetical protein